MGSRDCLVDMRDPHQSSCPACGGRFRAAFPPLKLNVDGKTVTLQNVPGYVCESCGEIYRELEAVVLAKAIARLSKLGLYPNDLPAILLLYAPVRGRSHVPIKGKTLFQKALWYLSQATKSMPSVPSPHFIPMQGGPWDPNLDGRIARLTRFGFVTPNPKSGPRETTFYDYKLTPEGVAAFKAIWDALPGELKDAAVHVKERLDGLTAQQAVDMVHDEFPEMWDKSKVERWGVTEAGATK